jgi:hypothetical protein
MLKSFLMITILAFSCFSWTAKTDSAHVRGGVKVDSGIIAKRIAADSLIIKGTSFIDSGSFIINFSPGGLLGVNQDTVGIVHWYRVGRIVSAYIDQVGFSVVRDTNQVCHHCIVTITGWPQDLRTGRGYSGGIIEIPISVESKIGQADWSIQFNVTSQIDVALTVRDGGVGTLSSAEITRFCITYYIW